jgi:predicted ribosome quality control (RQC) complex YloA/Tae2 family protein
MQTSLHIRALVEQMKQEIIDGEITSTAFYKKLRAAYIFVRSDSGHWAFGFLFHPGGAGVFLVPASKIEIETTEKPWPIFELAEATLSDISQIGLDRIFAIRLKTVSGDRQVICEAIGPNGNLWFTDTQNRILATLRHREHKSFDVYQPMPPREGLSPLQLSTGQLKPAIDHVGDHTMSTVTFVEKHTLGFNRTLAREAAVRAGVESTPVKELTAEQTAGLSHQISAIAEAFAKDSHGYLYHHRDTVEVYPLKLRRSSDEPEKFKTLSLAVLAMINTRQDSKVEIDESKAIIGTATKQVERLATRLHKIEGDISHAADFEKFKQMGDLLHTHFTRIKRGMKHLRVANTFDHNHVEIDIPLDPALPPKQNVENYYKKHRKGREGLELLERRLEITRQELEQWREIARELNDNFESARQKYAEELQSLLPKEKVKVTETVRLPYREATLSTGLTIYIGRDGADNDRTTFEFAKPYELWFHAQQCPGSHVVMKFPNKSFVPSKREIEETAAIAAFHSKAKNNSAVPVIYTERRYVRKPRKAKPGLVTVEREKSLMVVPRKAAGEK